MSYRKWNPGCPCCVVPTVAVPTPVTWRPRGRTFTLHDNCYGNNTYEDWIGATVTLTVSGGSGLFGWANGTRTLPLFNNSVPGGTLNKSYRTIFQTTSGILPPYVWRFDCYLGVAPAAPPSCELILSHGTFNANYTPDCSLVYKFSSGESSVEASGLQVNVNVVF